MGFAVSHKRMTMNFKLGRMQKESHHGLFIAQVLYLLGGKEENHKKLSKYGWPLGQELNVKCQLQNCDIQLL